MCKLFIGINKEKDNTEFNQYVLANAHYTKDQRDGISILTLGFDDKIKVIRQLNDYDGAIKELSKHLNGSKLVAVHTRQATTGAVTVENTHLFDIKGYYFAHNGFVMKYHSPKYGFASYNPYGRTNSLWNDDEETLLDKIGDVEDCEGCFTSKAGICKRHKRAEELEIIAEARRVEAEQKAEHKEKKQEKKHKNIAYDKSDSYQFLQGLLEKVPTIENIEKEIKKTDFSGAGFLLGEKNLDGYFIAHKETYSQSDRKSFALFYSYEPRVEFVQKRYEEEKLFGVSIQNESEVKLELNLPVHKVAKGTYKMEI